MAKVNNEKANLLLLFERPMEPSFIPKGVMKTVFDVPNTYLADRYKKSGPAITAKFGEDANHVSVANIKLPDLTVVRQLGRRNPFSLFLPWHRQLASHLIDIFMGMQNIADLTSAALYCRDNLNPQLFVYAYSVALLHRKDTNDVALPPLSEVFPDKFISGEVFGQVKEEIAMNREEENRKPVVISQYYTATDLEEEHRVAYFREDLGINLHHWHWHLVYPNDAAMNLVNKDRRGELFYYMHQQLLARYNLERFSQRLFRTKRMIDIRESIPEGYFPKMDRLVSKQTWPARQTNAKLRDINREEDQINFDLSDLERWRERIYEAIHINAVFNERGERIVLTEENGIDTLGNMIEASTLTANKNYYGDLHNLGHIAIAYCHDPDQRHRESFGVMGDTATAMRDPIFYRWHAMINDLFLEYKATLPRYEVEQLDFKDVLVTDVEVNVIGVPGSKKNELATFWQQVDVDLSRGLDFQHTGSVFARFTHLQHAPFSYKITVDNAGATRQGTVRIFLGPKQDERGLPMLFKEQKELFVEMDKWTVTLNPKINVIERRSIESSVTIPYERTFRNLKLSPTVNKEQFNFCGCGWPDHMLLPMGKAGGMEFQLFVMVSDYEGDQVDQSMEGACTDASSYCGIRDKKYPDRRSMGYPFDRQPRNRVETLQAFLTGNMHIQDVIIRFTNRTEKPEDAKRS